MTGLFVTSAGVLLVYVVAQWLASIMIEDASLVDRFWGGGFALVALVSFAYLDSATARAGLLFLMAVIWGLRLSTYLTWRNWGKGEDYRYRAKRTYHGSRFMYVSLFTVFILQGILTWIISMPLQVGISANTTPPLNPIDLLGVMVWLVGLLFETIGDFQLARFKSNPRNAGRVLERGLWRYTRHPNYFGDSLVWWGMYLVAVSAPYGVYTIFSPILMTFLLVSVSGVRLQEKRLKTRPNYKNYITRTNSFIPGPPRPMKR